jgi:hypothetical protein
MKKLLLFVAALLTGPIWAPAVHAAGATAIATSKRVVVSTAVAGTEILAADPYAQKTCLLNATTNYIMLSSASGGFSISATTGSFRLSGTVASTNPAWWCLDGPSGPYKGPLYGVSGAAGDMTVDVLRTQ